MYIIWGLFLSLPNLGGLPNDILLLGVPLDLPPREETSLIHGLFNSNSDIAVNFIYRHRDKRLDDK